MFGGGIEDIGFILFIAFLLFGPKKLPEIARVLGKGLGELRRARDELKFSLEEEIRNLELDKQHLVDRVVERTLDIDDYGIEEPAELAESAESAPAYGHDSTNPTPKHHDPEEELNGKQMSFLEHLEELRQRLMHSIIGIVVAAGVCFAFHDRLYALLAKPLTDTLKNLHLTPSLAFLNPVDPFNLFIKLSLVGGLFLACPYVLYQMWLFVSPGLYKHEKRYIWPFILLTSSLFVTGGFFAWRFAFPAALEFLLRFAHQFTPVITIDEYWDLAIQVIVAVGIIFELPVVILLLSFFGIVTPKFLWKNLRYAVLVTAVLSAAIIPSNDLASIFIVWIPLVALYMLSILLSWFVWLKKKRKKLQTA